MANKDINRIKVVLVEQKKTAKWLAEELGKDPATVSKWCTNLSQPSLETLVEVSKVLGVDVRELLVSTKEEPRYIRIDWIQCKIMVDSTKFDLGMTGSE